MCFKQNPTPPPKTVCQTYVFPPSPYFSAMSPAESNKYIASMNGGNFGQNDPPVPPVSPVTPVFPDNKPANPDNKPANGSIVNTDRLYDTVVSYEMFILIISLVAVVYMLVGYK
jgi:hypothetical protein